MKNFIYIIVFGLGIAGGWLAKPDVFKIQKETVYVKSEPEVIIKEQPPVIEQVVVYKNRKCKNRRSKKSDSLKESIFTPNESVASTKKEQSKPEKKNRVNLIVGNGPSSISASVNGSDVSVKQNSGLTMGVQYERKIIKDLNLNLMYQNNKTYSIGIGSDF